MPKVLIIDDDPAIREAYAAICRHKKWEVELANDGNEGLAAAQKANPDIILLDMLMPGMGGIDFLEAFNYHQHSNPPKIIVLTNSQVPAESEQRVKQLGASAYKVKSKLDPKDLVGIVSGHLKH